MAAPPRGPARLLTPPEPPVPRRRRGRCPLLACGPLTSRNPSALLTFTPCACSPHLAPARPVPTSPLWFGLLRNFVSIDSRKKSLLTDLLAVSVTQSRAVQVVRALPAGPFPPPGGPEPRSPLVGRGASGVCAWGPAGPLR